MKTGLKILLPIVASLLPGLAAAADKPEQLYVRCVQNELSALGMSGISQTGKVDRATKAAAEAVRAQYPNARGLALLPKLNDASAVSWCREIATVKPAL